MSIFAYIPVVGHVGCLIRAACGDKEGAKRARERAMLTTSYVPVLGHVQAVTLACMGEEHREEAKVNLARSTGSAAGVGLSILAAPVAAAGAGAAAGALGVAGATGGVGSGLLAASATGALASIGGRACQAGSEAGTNMKKSNREACSSSVGEWAKEAGLGAVGGAVGGSVLGKASAAGKGIAQQGLGGVIASRTCDAVGVHGVGKYAAKVATGKAFEAGARKALQ